MKTVIKDVMASGAGPGAHAVRITPSVPKYLSFSLSEKQL